MKSSAYQKVVFHHDHNLLDVTYNNGQTFRYHGVSGRTWQEFQNAPSKGVFLRTHIKKGHRSEQLHVV